MIVRRRIGRMISVNILVLTTTFIFLSSHVRVVFSNGADALETEASAETRKAHKEFTQFQNRICDSQDWRYPPSQYYDYGARAKKQVDGPKIWSSQTRAVVQMSYRSGAAAEGTVVLILQARNLVNRDLALFAGDVSDPKCYIYYKDKDGVTWKKIGETETVKNDLNPDFKLAGGLQFHGMEKDIILKFEIVDVDFENLGTPRYETLGFVENVNLVDILGQRQSLYPIDVSKLGSKYQNKGGDSKLFISTEKINSEEDVVFIALTGLEFPKFTGGQFYFIFEENGGDAENQIHLHTSEMKATMRSSGVRWRNFTIRQQTLNVDRPFRVRAMEKAAWGSGAQDKLVGQFSLDGNAILNLRPTDNGISRTLSGGTGDSLIVKPNIVLKAQVGVRPFTHYVQTGKLRVSVIVAIDLTYSNSPPTKSNSNHFMTLPNKPTDPIGHYTQQRHNFCSFPLEHIGSAIAQFDDDKMFPLSAFGVRIDGKLKDFVELNGGDECKGVPGLLQAYFEGVSLYRNRFGGPTNFGPTIRKAIRHTAKANRMLRLPRTHRYHRIPFSGDVVNYNVMAIFTDGKAHDLNRIKKYIVLASNSLPLSFLIICIGEAFLDCNNMEVLDGDDVALSYTNKKGRVIYAKYDIVDAIIVANIFEAVVVAQEYIHRYPPPAYSADDPAQAQGLSGDAGVLSRAKGGVPELPNEKKDVNDPFFDKNEVDHLKKGGHIGTTDVREAMRKAALGELPGHIVQFMERPNRR